MNVLVIGGNRFVGYQLVWRLLGAGHQVTVVNRGSNQESFLGRVPTIIADRTTRAFDEALAGQTFDAVVDFALYTEEDALQVTRLFKDGAIGHYICISSGQVYLVRENCPSPATEIDYAGTVMAKPTNPDDYAEWKYGVDKRKAEDVLIRAWEQERFPATRLRIPVVNGERDYSRRLESYFWRILDGGPILLPGDDTKRLRQIYSEDIARTIESILLNPETFGQAYNLAQDETVTIRELVNCVAGLFNCRPHICVVPEHMFEQEGLRIRDVSPFHGKWTSIIDPSKAAREIGFVHTPFEVYLDKVVTSFLNNMPKDPPQGYKCRNQERIIAKAFTP